MKILTVDDSKAVHALMDFYFTSTDVEVHHAMNGQQALQFISTNTDLDLILLDWEMPGLLGVDVLRKIVQTYKGLKVVMVTSKNEPNEILKVLQIGAKDYIMKPFTDDILFQKVEMVTEKAIKKYGT